MKSVSHSAREKAYIYCGWTRWKGHQYEYQNSDLLKNPLVSPSPTIMAHLCNPDVPSLIFVDAFQNATSSVLTLRSVNRTWFYVAGSTPRLWTSLILNRKSDFTNLEYAQLYLQKSGVVLIDVRIVLPDDVDVNDIGGVTALLRPHTSRLRSFDLVFEFKTKWRPSSLRSAKAGPPQCLNAWW
ncbi:hypothetical protein M413DRAFT_450137 [Hebeloma cylindrosporum]|uniref:F-box domain-containing protein n=1 Tax=Hebeloma cylindrosporum TaxID=76867 RepID=A0A0C3BTG6_HEBCY|nr:hypothetical protein M413DRAFT_450138 [Hebeloma cylindrosporum h7]KIM34647.1 hypothetical protein M413DRAFT_450137 [Hebeloma cylindrosporum h7]